MRKHVLECSSAASSNQPLLPRFLTAVRRRQLRVTVTVTVVTVTRTRRTTDRCPPPEAQTRSTNSARPTVLPTHTHDLSRRSQGRSPPRAQPRSRNHTQATQPPKRTHLLPAPHIQPHPAAVTIIYCSQIMKPTRNGKSAKMQSTRLSCVREDPHLIMYNPNHSIKATMYSSNCNNPLQRDVHSGFSGTALLFYSFQSI